MATYTSSQAGLWNASSTWGGAGWPNANADVVNIGHDVTYNVNDLTVYMNTVTINSGGILNFSTSMNTALRFSNVASSLKVNSGGELRVGTSGSPLDKQYKCIIEFAYYSSGARGIDVADGGLFNTYGDPGYYGSAFYGILKGTWSSGNIIYVSGDKTGWQPGQWLGLHRNPSNGFTSQTFANMVYYYKIYQVGPYDSENDRTQIIFWNSSPSTTHYDGGYVVNPFRNIIIRDRSSTDNPSYKYSTGGLMEHLFLSQTKSNINIYDTVFWGFAYCTFQELCTVKRSAFKCSVTGPRSLAYASANYNFVANGEFDECLSIQSSSNGRGGGRWKNSIFFNYANAMDEPGLHSNCVYIGFNYGVIGSGQGTMQFSSYDGIAIEVGYIIGITVVAGACYWKSQYKSRAVGQLFGNTYVHGAYIECDIDVLGFFGSGIGCTYIGNIDKVNSHLSGGCAGNHIFCSSIGSTNPSTTEFGSYVLHGCDLPSGFSIDPNSQDSNTSYIYKKYVVLERCKLAGVREDLRVYTHGGNFLPIRSGDSGWSAPISNNDWVFKFTPSTYSKRPLYGNRYRSELYTSGGAFKDMPFYRRAAGLSYLRVNVRPVGWSPILTKDDILVEVYYPASSTPKMSLLKSTTTDFSNDQWTSIDIGYTMGRAGEMYYNIVVWVTYQSSAYILIDPIVGHS